MADRPGSLLDISSHFIPRPRSSMMRASSSSDHFDCFLAGVSAGWGAWPRLVDDEDGVGGTDDALWALEGGGSSSSFGIKS